MLRATGELRSHVVRRAKQLFWIQRNRPPGDGQKAVARLFPADVCFNDHTVFVVISAVDKGEPSNHRIDGLARSRERAVCEKGEVSALSRTRINFEVRHALPHGVV